MSVRTYNPSVRVGNWNEDIQLEEDTLKDFLARRERGELLIQKNASLLGSANEQLKLSTSRDGRVHFGDTVMLLNPATKDKSRGEAALALNIGRTGPEGVSAASGSTASARTAFVVTSCDGTPDGQSLKYGQKFCLCTRDGQHFLGSEQASLFKCAKKSRHNEVFLRDRPSADCHWKVFSFDPLLRPEYELTDVPANEKVIITHVNTYNNLSLEAHCPVRTVFGSEFEVSTYTDLDSHKAERDGNHWVFVMATV